MSFALSTGVTGLDASQKMLDVAGNNIANVSTTAYKASRIGFSELLSETIKQASQPTTDSGGTNPQQMGSGVGVASITPNMSQGNIVSTGNPLDMAIEGSGYFVVNDGSKNVYTRAGAFAVDAKSNLVDPATGYIIQRIGSTGESDGLQTIGDSNIRIPYDTVLAASATSLVKMQGNLSADAVLSTTQTQELASDITFSAGSAAPTSDTLITALDQYSCTGSTPFTSAAITVAGTSHDGTALSDGTPLTVTGSTTLGDVIDHLNAVLGTRAMTSDITYTDVGATIDTDTLLTSLDQYSYTSGTAFDAATITVTGKEHDGTALTDSTPLAVTEDTTLGDIIDHINSVLGTGATASLVSGQIVVTDATGGSSQLDVDLTFDNDGTAEVTMPGSFDYSTVDATATASLSNGQIVITDAASGYSKLDLNLAFANAGDAALTMPGYFKYSTVGGDEVQNISTTIYDSQGGSHVLSGSLVRTDDSNTWDMLLASITGDVNTLSYGGRRIEGIKFGADGSYAGLDDTTGDTAKFSITFTYDASSPQEIEFDLGTTNKFNGLTQFATGASGTSTAVAREQNGYAAGTLSSVSISKEGTIVGSFSNGVKKDIAALKIALFQNSAGLESIGGGYFIPSGNSGDAIATKGMSGGAGSIHGGALEKSNADVATEFVNMIEAQNSYQANARTIRVATDVLRELTNLIR